MRCISLLFTAALLPLYAAPALDQLLPPRPAFVFGIRASTLLGLIEKQEGMKEVHGQIQGLLALTPLAGFDPFHDIDEVVVAANGMGQNPPTLAVITGRFNAAQMAGKNGYPYRNAVLVSGSKPDQTMAILDANTLLAGDLPLIKAAIDRTMTNLAPSPIASRLEDLRSRYDIWAFADHLDSAALPPMASNPLKGIDRLSFGAAFAQNFELSGELHFKTQADLARITAMIRDLEKQIAPAKFEVTTTNETLKVALAVPEEVWKKALAARNQMQAATRTASEPKFTGPPTPQVITRDATGNTVSLTLPSPTKQ